MSELSKKFDEVILEILKNGRDIVTKDGDKVNVQATPADLNVIRQRLKDKGKVADEDVTDEEVSTVEEIAKRMRDQGLTLHGTDRETDDAATA